MALTYAERRAMVEARRDARRSKLEAEAAHQYGKVREIMDRIPMGQPILVDHYSAKGHRRDLARMDTAMGKSVAASKAAEAVPDATTAILSSDADAIDQLRAKLAEAEADQERMKQVNAIIKRHGTAAEIAALGYSEAVAQQLRNPQYAWQGQGFASYRLSNNSANIRRMRLRVEQLEKAKAAPAVSRQVGNSGVTVEEDPEAMRLRLRFPGKPAPEVIAELKSYGFRWAPSEGAWQAHLSNKARWSSERIIAFVQERAA